MTSTSMSTDQAQDDRNRLPTKSEIAAAKLVQITQTRLGRPIPEWINRVALGLTPRPGKGGLGEPIA